MATKRKKKAKPKTNKRKTKLVKSSRKKIRTKKKLGQKSLRLRSVLKNLEKIISLKQQKKQEE